MVRIDDSLDVFAEHGIGGIVGLIWNAFFAYDWVIGLDGVNVGITGGFVNGHYRQIYMQIAYIFATCAYAFVVSALIAKAIDLVPGLKLRASEEAELLGLDDDQHGEFSYDYVEVRRDFLAWSPQKTEQMPHTKIIPVLGEQELSSMQARSNNHSISSSHGKHEQESSGPEQEPEHPPSKEA